MPRAIKLILQVLVVLALLVAATVFLGSRILGKMLVQQMNAVSPALPQARPVIPPVVDDPAPPPSPPPPRR